ncbi:ArnT family glycosyltransferase [Mangrovimonas xylaniphaga]|uniref:ArnT family glycosyltransferase n=1 Tax=Mangrovimonas xylaniphaga TaxID=1645915 RepID=UPI0006B51F55|nr:glycosyltransferase family 39 protein [Mangrovimonas xylaniphaga]
MDTIKRFTRSIDIVNTKFLLGSLAVLLFVLLLTSSKYPLAETSEARYAEISREMLVSGDFLHPQLLGIYHYHKPPMTYWITVAGYKLFGVNEFGSRFFLQIAVICQVVLVFLLGKLLYNDKRVRVLSALTYLAFPIVLISSRNLTTDAYLTTFIMASVFFWLKHFKTGNPLYLYAFFIAMAASIVTKGPVSLIFILSFVVLFCYSQKMGLKLTWNHVLGFLLFLILASGWFIYLILEDSKLLDYFVVDQLAHRISSDSFNRGKPFWFYIPVVLGLLLPWVLLLIFRNRKILKEFEIQTSDKALLMASVLVFVVFSLFKTKLLMYLLPMFWMLALLIGHQLTRISKLNVRVLMNVVLGITLLVALVPILLSWLKPNFIASSGILRALVLAVILLASIVAYVFRNAPQTKLVLQFMVFIISTLAMAQVVLMQNPHLSNSVKPMLAKINELDQSRNDKDTILVYDYLLSSAPFYSNLKTITLHYDHNTSERDLQFQHSEEWKNGLVDLKNENDVFRLAPMCANGNTYMLVRRKKPVAEEFSFLNKSFSHHIDYPNWILYYN